MPHTGGTIAVALPVMQPPSTITQYQQQQAPVQNQQQTQQQSSSDSGFVRGHSVTEVYTNNNYVSCSSGLGIQFGSVGALSNPSSGELAVIHQNQANSTSNISPQQQQDRTISDSNSSSAFVKTGGSSTGGGVVITKIVEHPYSMYGSTSAIYTDTEDEWSRRASAVDPREIQMVAERMMRTMPNLFTEVTRKLAAADSQTNLASSTSNNINSSNNNNTNNSSGTATTTRNYHIDLDGSLPNLNNLESVVAATAALAAGSTTMQNPVTNNTNSFSNLISSQPNIPCNSLNNINNNVNNTNLISNATISATTPNISGIGLVGGDTTILTSCDNRNDQNYARSAVVANAPHVPPPQHQQANSSSIPFSASSHSVAPTSSPASASNACCNLNKANKLQVGGGFIFYILFLIIINHFDFYRFFT